MEICIGPFSGQGEIRLIVEPWADEFLVAPESRLCLQFDGEAIEPLDVDWLPDAVMVWPPRYSVVRVLSPTGEELRRFDTRKIPPTPPLRS